MSTDSILWGFNARNSEPIKLTGGTPAECRTELAFRTSQGWDCAIYRKGSQPIGLRELAAERRDNA